MTLALDANVVIDLMRGRDEVRRAHMAARLSQTRFTVSVLVVQELRYGAEVSARPGVEHGLVDGWLTGMEVLPFEIDDVGVAARVQALMQRRGRRAPYSDFLIGAHALARGHALVTANTSDFQNIPDLHLLDWRRGPGTSQDDTHA